MCVGRAPNWARNKASRAHQATGLHHACIITPHGDYCLEPASTAAFRQPAAYEELTPAAHATVLSLLHGGSRSRAQGRCGPLWASAFVWPGGYMYTKKWPPCGRRAPGARAFCVFKCV